MIGFSAVALGVFVSNVILEIPFSLYSVGMLVGAAIASVVNFATRW